MATGARDVAIDAPSRVLLAFNIPEFIALSVTLAAYVIALVQAGPFRDLMNLLGPSVLIVALAYSCMTMMLRGVISIWTPLFWFRISYIAYCGVGSLVPFLVNDATRDLIESFYQFFPGDVIKYNIITTLFMLMILVGSQIPLNVLVTGRNRNRLKESAARLIEPCGLELRTMGLILLTMGAFVSYVLLLPYQLGFVRGTLNQYIPQLALAMQVSFFLLTYWALKERSSLIYLISLMVIIDSILGVIQFSKTAAIFPLIMAAFGAIYHKPRLMRIIVLGVPILGFYFTVVPIVTYSRIALAQVYGSFLEAPVGERISIILEYDAAKAQTQSESDQLGWVRLSYVNAGTFAINEYDNGRPGHSLEQALAVFVPRALWPDKPIITKIGQDFNIAVNGNPDSQSSPGMAADLYWSSGLVGVIVGGLFVGVFLSLWSLYSITVMRTEAWHLLFLVLLGLRVGQASAEFFVPAILGPISFAVIAHIVLTLLNRLTQRRKRGRRMATP